MWIGPGLQEHRRGQQQEFHGAAGGFAAEKPHRGHPGVVDHQERPGRQEVRQVGETGLGSSAVTAGEDHEPRGVTFGQGPLGDEPGRQMELVGVEVAVLGDGLREKSGVGHESSVEARTAGTSSAMRRAAASRSTGRPSSRVVEVMRTPGSPQGIMAANRSRELFRLMARP